MKNAFVGFKSKETQPTDRLTIVSLKIGSQLHLHHSILALEMKLRKSLLSLTFAILIAAPSSVLGQDIDYAKEVINELCSDIMAGRGYVNDGDNAAAFYIEEAFLKYKLENWDFDYNQTFEFPVNRFPETVEVALDGVELKPGGDFIVVPSCPSSKIELPILRIETKPRVTELGASFGVDSLTGYAVVMEDSIYKELSQFGHRPLDILKANGAKAIIRLTDKLTWAVSSTQDEIPTVVMLRDKIGNAKSVKLNIEAELKKKHRTQNVIGFIEGAEEPEKFVVFTGHYDHLGMMGKDAMFRGANDNASGIAMMLNFVKHFSQPGHRPKKSIVFMAFAGEEAGLLGSQYYVQNPLFPLDQIEFVINVDLLGTGEDGITVVNGSIHPEEFNALVELNDRNKYLKRVKKRGKAANSDHYPFSEKGVPAFFIYTMGGITAYHDIYDLPETLPLTEFEDVFKLIRDFIYHLEK
jgi:aminopeptidase YwaD